MSAQPIHDEDPQEPTAILRALPEREHADFLHQYQEAAQAAVSDLDAYRKLKKLLHAWSIRAQVVSRPGYYEDREAEIEAIRNGTMKTVPMDEGLAQAWNITIDEARAMIARSRAGRA